MHILIIDNYDSFTYNLYHLAEAVMRPECKLTVCRNDAINISDAARYDKIIVSPGPGLPKDAGISCEIIRRYAADKKASLAFASGIRLSRRCLEESS